MKQNHDEDFFIIMFIFETEKFQTFFSYFPLKMNVIIFEISEVMENYFVRHEI